MKKASTVIPTDLNPLPNDDAVGRVRDFTFALSLQPRKNCKINGYELTEADLRSLLNRLECAEALAWRPEVELVAKIIDPAAWRDIDVAGDRDPDYKAMRGKRSLSKASAILGLGDKGEGSSVARVDVTPPSGASAETEGL